MSAPAPPPPSPPPAALLGVVLSLSCIYPVAALLTAWLIYKQRAYLHVVPSTLSVTGTVCGKGQSCALLAFRVAVALWQAGIVIVFFAHKGRGWQLLFYTLWNYLLQTIFWILAAATSAIAWWRTAEPPAMLRRMTHLLLSICMPSSILVSIVLWGVLLPNSLAHGSTAELNYWSYNMHAINTFLLLVECCTNRLLLHPATLGLIFAWVLLYSAFCWIQHSVTGFWPYFFMSMSSWSALGWYPALIVLHFLVYGAVLFLSRCKARRNHTLLNDQSPASGNLYGVDELAENVVSGPGLSNGSAALLAQAPMVTPP
jgi:hypothetical protein